MDMHNLVFGAFNSFFELFFYQSEMTAHIYKDLKTGVGCCKFQLSFKVLILAHDLLPWLMPA